MDGMKSAGPGWTADTEKEFMDSLPSGFCPECGGPVYQKPKGRRKKFCSEACRFAWKNKHPNPANWKLEVNEDGGMSRVRQGVYGEP